MSWKKIFYFVIFTSLLLQATPQVFAETKPVINEFLPAPGDNKEWVEIYNPDKIDISQYYIDDDTTFDDTNDSQKKKLLTEISHQDDSSYYVLEFSSFLNNTGDWVVLFNSSGEIVDSYQYTDTKSDISIGRANNSGEFGALQTSTKGSLNSGFVPTPTSIPPTATPITKPPTNTPIPPTNTQVPPTATLKIPTPTKVPTPTKSPTPKPTSTQTTSTKISSKPLAVNASGDVLAAADTSPLSLESEKKDIMGVDLVPSPTPTQGPTAPTKVLGQSNINNQFVILIAVGVVLVLSCGILLIRKYFAHASEE